MVEVWLDGVQQTTIDLYSASRHTQQIVWAPSAPLSAGNHTLELRLTGTKRPASGGTRVDLDALLVW
jgi:mannan endo-1,4-beta-mannosidase